MTARQWAAGITALVVLLGLAFAAGRFTAPEQVREVEKLVWKDRIIEKVVTKKAKAVDRVVYVDRTVLPSGEVREKTSTRTITDARETNDVAKTTESTGEKITTPARPDWRVGALVGASLREPLLPIAGPLVLGAHVERRIAGPFTMGLWFTTGGAAGLSATGEF